MIARHWDTIGRWIIYGVLLAVFVGPYWGVLATAFSGAMVKPGELLAWPQDPTLRNFDIAWNDLGVWRYLLNSMIVVTAGTILQTSVSACAAYALARKRFVGAAVTGLIILSTMMLPEEIIAIPLYLVVRWELPVIDTSLYNTYFAMVLPVVGWAFSIFLLTEFMRTIPKELEEAAQVDGAGEWRIFFCIILPLVRPALGTSIIFGFIMIWDQYLLPLIVINDEKLYTIPVMLGFIRVDESITPNIFIAVTLLAMLPSIIVYLIMQKHFNRGILSGAVKG